ncbi:MAG TPA: DUF6152 family protein [Bryobacteraceae bacterium]|jgi:hypothetical protein|nr:DUF6152 family protein [Bryobacteraceae bacterium]
MKNTIPRVAPMILALCISLVFAGAAWAHHGWSGYDETKPLNLTGTIRDSGYDNPHGFVELEVAGNPAKTWHVVLAPPSRMETRGLPKEMLKRGAAATVVGYQEKTKPGELRAERITIDGKTTELR